jgi:hypothetical protein
MGKVETRVLANLWNLGLVFDTHAVFAHGQLVLWAVHT